jgi:hypothetical protein
MVSDSNVNYAPGRVKLVVAIQSGVLVQAKEPTLELCMISDSSESSTPIVEGQCKL